MYVLPLKYKVKLCMKHRSVKKLRWWPLYFISSVWLSASPWTIARQAPRSTGILQASMLEWVAIPSSRGSSQPKDQTQVSHIASGFFTIRATREAQEYWSGQPIPSPEDLSDPGIELGSPSLQADSLPVELPRKPSILYQLSYQGEWKWSRSVMSNSLRPQGL